MIKSNVKRLASWSQLYNNVSLSHHVKFVTSKRMIIKRKLLCVITYDIIFYYVKNAKKGI